MTYDQLRDVQSEICRMARIRDSEKFFPYFPKGMADETTKIYSDREGAAYELWLLVKKFTQTEPCGANISRYIMVSGLQSTRTNSRNIDKAECGTVW